VWVPEVPYWVGVAANKYPVWDGWSTNLNPPFSPVAKSLSINSAGRRAELSQRCRILAELRIILSFSGMDGSDRFDSRHFLGIGAGFGQLRQGNSQNNQDDRDNDQKLNQRKSGITAASAVWKHSSGSLPNL
jgi:hypothetical protein